MKIFVTGVCSKSSTILSYHKFTQTAQRTPCENLLICSKAMRLRNLRIE
jgi:hypothetical protein